MSAGGITGMCLGLAAAGISLYSVRRSGRALGNSRRAAAHYVSNYTALAEEHAALVAQLNRLRFVNRTALGLHWPPEVDFVCPACHRVSANGFDLVAGWCAACKDFTAEPIVDHQSAAHVMTHFEGLLWGAWWPAGEFSQTIIDAACRSDMWNLRRLLRAFPELTTAVWLYKEVPGGREFLTNLCRRYRERADRRPGSDTGPRPPAAPLSIAEILQAPVKRAAMLPPSLDGLAAELVADLGLDVADDPAGQPGDKTG